MFNIIDRQLIFNYVKSYLICLVSLMGLFIVVDLFMNLDNFTEEAAGFEQALERIVKYYGMKSIQIFDRICEAIVLMAAMFTVAMVQRNNELLPLLSAGVSTRRVVRPVLFSACLMLGLTSLNQEMVIPNIADRLTSNRDDPDGTKQINCIQGAYEPNNIHIEGLTAIRSQCLVREFDCWIPPEVAGSNPLTLHAKEARYIKPG